MWGPTRGSTLGIVSGFGNSTFQIVTKYSSFVMILVVELKTGRRRSHALHASLILRCRYSQQGCVTTGLSVNEAL